jgi:WD40 repeat protein
VAASPDGRFFATTGGAWIYLYNRQGNLLHRFSLNQYTHHHVVFSADSRWLIASNNEGDSSLWDLENLDAQGNRPAQFLPAPKGVKISGAVSPDGRTLARGGDVREIWLTDLQTLAVTRIPNQPDRIWALSFSADSQVLASASEDGTAKLWTRQGKLLATLHHGGAVWGAAISPTAPIVATASREGTLKLWDFQGNLLRTIPGQSKGLTRVAFSPDGQTLATGGIDNTVKLWNLEGNLLNVLPGHRGSVVSLTFSADGQLLLSGGDEGAGMLWDLEKIRQTNEDQYACQWLGDYLEHSQDVSPEERQLCPP